MSTANRIVPVLLAGGSGTRLWPLSRETLPKQFLPLIGERTLLQETAARIVDTNRFAPPIVVGNAAHRFLIAEQLRAIGCKPSRIVLEPHARNTAPAVAVAALLAVRSDAHAVLLVMPADHAIGRVEPFLAAVASGLEAARSGSLVLFGAEPKAPVTGYGYIEMGAPIGASRAMRKVARFTEKPDRATAARYLAEGGYLWNSGIFLLPASGVIAELERLEPAIVVSCRDALAAARSDDDFLRLDEAAFARAPSIAIDVAVMERTEAAVVVPVDCDWTDVGSWSALWDVGTKDAGGNTLVGNAVAEGATNSYLRSDGPLIAAIGVDHLVVVATPDAVLVVPKERDHEVKGLVERLRREGRTPPER